MAEKHTRTSDDRTVRESRGIGRRALLAGIGAGGVSAAVAVGGSVSAPTEDQPAPSKDQPVYRETDHIREFYARSRF